MQLSAGDDVACYLEEGVQRLTKDPFTGSRIDGYFMIDLPKPLLLSSLNLVPAHTWYADPSGALTFVNQRCADYLGLPKDHPLRFGMEGGGAWDAHLAFLHPDDHDGSRKAWSTCINSASAGEFTFRIRNGDGVYRWFLSRAEPHRGADGET